jgi:hypothetical protein
MWAENKMKERKLNWKKVLNEISNYSPRQYSDNYGADHPLIKRLKINPSELVLIMSFLKEQGLIEYKKSECNQINLTSKGLDMSLQNKSASNTHLISQASLFISIAAVIFALISLLHGISDALTLRYGILIAASLVAAFYIIIKCYKL